MQADLKNGASAQEFRVKEVRLIKTETTDPTGITPVATPVSSKEKQCYDLLGRPVNGSTHKGVIISGGKKLIKK